MGGWTKGLIIRAVASVLPSLCARVGRRSRPAPATVPRVRTCAPGPGLARPLQSGLLRAQEVGETQVADLLHLAQGGAQLLRRRAVQPARQLPRHGRPVAQARGEHEGEAKARAVLRVELRQLEPLVGVQARQARASLLPLRLRGERSPLQLAARQVRVAAQDALLACRKA